MNGFVSYSHQDASMTERLLKHLKQATAVSLWTDREIEAGDLWDDKIRAALEQSRIIILCVSADFFWSKYIQSVELQHAMARHMAGTALIIPVILKPVLWEANPFLAKLQAVPKAAKPIQLWRPTESGYADTARRIHDAIAAQDTAAGDTDGVENR